MRFTVTGSRIICSRRDNTIESDAAYRQVVEFDAHLDSIPPHVEAKLTQRERQELEDILADRKRIQANPAVVNMLEALPELLGDASESIESVDRLNADLYRKLRASVRRMSEALERVRPKGDEIMTPVRRMRRSEALKERIENYKRDL